jgi:hypothetical protein
MNYRHCSSHSTQDGTNHHWVSPQLLQVKRLKIEKHPFAKAPSEQGEGYQDKIAAQVTSLMWKLTA